MVAITEKLAEVRRVLDRYIVEVVEAYGFCPWARAARVGGEIGVTVIFGTPTPEQLADAGRALLARPEIRVAMVVTPEISVPQSGFRVVREAVTKLVDTAGIADFHPDAELDLGTPARLVPFTRRSPDPLLQFVPLALLKSVRYSATPPDLAEQARLLGGVVTDPSEDIGDRIAETNHTRVTRELAEISRVLADIAADRDRSYARVGIEPGGRKPANG
jgi:hypothetical protein